MNMGERLNFAQSAETIMGLALPAEKRSLWDTIHGEAVDGADALVTNPLAHSELLQSVNCPSRPYDYGGHLSINTRIGPRLTLQRESRAVQ